MVRRWILPSKYGVVGLVAVSLAGCPATKPQSRAAQTASVSLLPASSVSATISSEVPSTPTTMSASSVQLGGSQDGGTIANPNGNHTGGDTGTIASPSLLTITPTQYDYGVQSLRSFAYKAFTVKNIGGRSATEMTAGGLSGAFSFKGGSYPGAGGTCAASLGPNTTCTIVISFQPSSMGKVANDEFLLEYNNGTLGLHLEGSGTDIATLHLTNLVDDRDAYDYGTLPFGSSMNHVFRVRYFGARPATGVTFSGATGAYTVVWNQCPTEISADCDLAVRFTGASAGLASTKLKVTYNNNAYAAETFQMLGGTTAQVVTQAVLTVTDADFGRTLVGTPVDRVIVVRKSGTRPAAAVAPRAMGSAFQFKGGNYPGVGGTCSATITTDCTMVVTFNPSAVVAYRDTVKLGYQSGDGQAEAEGYLSGLGATPASLAVTGPGSTDFGNIPVGKPIDKTVTVMNTDGGMRAVGVSAGGVSAPFQILGNCSDALAPGATCNVTVRFKPTSVGPVSGAVTITYFDGTETKTITQPLTGSGDGGALINFTQSTADAGGVRIGMQQIIEIDLSYYGVVSGGNCTVTGIDEGATSPGMPGTGAPGSGTGGFGYPGGTYPGTGGSCSHTIDSPCAIKITFIPTEVKKYTTQLLISYENGNGETKTSTITLKGNGLGTTPATLTFAGPTQDFGDVVVGARAQVQLNVHRTGDLSATQVSFSPVTAPFRMEGATCGTNVTTSDCKVTMSYQPTAAGGHDQSFTMTYFDGAMPQSATINLHGTAYDAAYLAAAVSPATKTMLGANGDYTVTITNRGTRAASAFAVVTAPADPFSLVSTDCASELAAASSCTANVRFTPARPGPATGAMRYAYDSGRATVSLDVALAAAGQVDMLVGANGNHSCARLDDGAVKCWGHNNYGQLGTGDAINRGDATDPAHVLSAVQPINLGAGRYAKAIAVGYWHSCALLDNDALKCWGENNYGQLGVGSSVATLGAAPGQMGDALPAVNLGSGVKAVSIAAGYAHTCAVLDSGAVKCWGYNGEGQLGLGDIAPRGTSAMGDALPTVDLGGARAQAVSASTGHTCALLDGGAVKCWGNNFFGQLGQEDFDNRGDRASTMGARLAAIDFGAGRFAKMVSAGGAFSCALLDNGAVKCWGRNESGILGRNWCQDDDGVAGDCADSRYSLPLRGYGLADGQMGDALPAVALGRAAVTLSAANSSVCAALDNGSVKCWGDNSYGQAGDDLGGTVTTIAAGGFHACAAMTDGSLKCWGDNRYGELGLGDTNNRGDEAGELGGFLAALRF